MKEKMEKEEKKKREEEEKERERVIHKKTAICKMHSK